MKYSRGIFVWSVVIAALGLSGAANAQWAFVARKSMGAIHSIQAEHTDVATVLLEAAPDRVYAAAVRTLNGKQGVRITRQDDATRQIDFTANGSPTTMKVSTVEEKVSMLTVTSPGSMRRTGDASPVVEGVLRVCNQMKVSCSLSKE